MSTPTERSNVSYMPVDLEAEKRVLGILIKYPGKVDEVVDRLQVDHFYDKYNRKIYRTILDLYNLQGRISYTEIYRRMRKDESVEAPDEALIALTESFVSQAELAPSMDILVENYGKRRLMDAVQKIEQMLLLETEEDLSSYQARAQELIFEATGVDTGAEDSAKDLIDVLTRCYRNLVDRREGNTAYGLSVRFPAIDVLTTGFKNGDLIILAGRPSMGKTSLALNFAINVAKRNIPVAIFSLEMDDEQIGDRMVVSELFRYQNDPGVTPVTASDYSTKLSDEKFALTESVFNDLYHLPIKIVDKRGLTLAEIRAKARKVKAEVPQLGLIVVDYLQLIRPPQQENKTWALVVGDMVRELRDLAGELDLPIILLSQLNRGVEMRDNKRPRMSDLRDSGNIEEFADVVMFIYRDEYYYPEKAEEEGTQGQVEVIIAKQRKGPTGKAILRWIPEYTRFIDETEREVANGFVPGN